jgi:hypothetical protein
MHRSKGVLSLLVSLAWTVGMLACGGDPTPPGGQTPTGGTGGVGGTGGLPTGGTGGTGGSTGTGGTGGAIVPGDCADDPGQESCARCLDAVMPVCIMQNANDCPEALGAYLICANDNGCMRDNGLPDMGCKPCVNLLGSALGCMQSCKPVADCL